MARIGYSLIIIAAAMVFGAVISRLVYAPRPLIVEAKTFVEIADTILFFVIALTLLNILKALKKKS